MKHDEIKIYPVGNGDTSLTKLRDKTTILIDCKIREVKPDNDVYDVKADLLGSVERRNDNPFVDLFVLTHPDNDHCQGFKKNFYQGDPENYSDKNRENGEIIIDEIWVTSILFTINQSDDANAIRNEVNRRIKLYNNEDPKKDHRGNRLFLIGYDKNEKFKNVGSYVPGDIVTEISGVKKDTFSFFVHAPFKDDLVKGKANKDRNATSIVLQARFKETAISEDYSFLAIFGGDADHYIWEKILEKSKSHNNEEALQWDLFLAPHHCSWTFFNDTPYKENKTPKEYSLEVLDYKRANAYVVASSKEIINNDDNPPHYYAKKEYLGKVDKSEYFLNTAAHTVDGEVAPIVFIVDGSSYRCGSENKEEDKSADAKQAKRAFISTGSRPWRK